MVADSPKPRGSVFIEEVNVAHVFHPPICLGCGVWGKYKADGLLECVGGRYCSMLCEPGVSLWG